LTFDFGSGHDLRDRAPHWASHLGRESA